MILFAFVIVCALFASQLVESDKFFCPVGKWEKPEDWRVHIFLR